MISVARTQVASATQRILTKWKYKYYQPEDTCGVGKSNQWINSSL